MTRCANCFIQYDMGVSCPNCHHVNGTGHPVDAYIRASLRAAYIKEQITVLLRELEEVEAEERQLNRVVHP